MSHEHVAPVFGGVLSALSGDARRAANDRFANFGKAIPCRVRISGADMHETFVGLYPTTGNALDAAMLRGGDGPFGVSVMRMSP
jgi:hypothetical protein